MAYIAYLTLRGEQQGLISRGRCTKDLMENHRGTHPDQISVLACHHLMSQGSHPQSLTYDTLQIAKCRINRRRGWQLLLRNRNLWTERLSFTGRTRQGHHKEF
ncbi:hypothetical protein P4S72_27670 [Vibrio sp. PP-XX7]